MRKADLIRLCEKHQDCAFLCFTNATLIDEGFCRDMIRAGNFVPAISAEGDEDTTDARRGKGTHAKIERAMDLLRENGLPFGISCCWTRENADAVATEENMDWMIGKGALFCWYFHYMPVGASSPASLIPTPEQRERMYHFVRDMRSKKELFTLDFQNDGEFVGGCIAGGRRYLHINAAGDVEPCVFIHYSTANIHGMTLLEALNAAGDVEPCVFIHYSTANIHGMTLLEALKSPLFMKYYESQPFNGNHLRPCPMLENPYELGRMVSESGAMTLLEALKSPLFMKYYESQPFNGNHLRPCPMLENPYELGRMVSESGAHGTDLVEPESPESLRRKTVPAAAAWAPVADRLWKDESDPMHRKREEDPHQGMTGCGRTSPTPCTASARRILTRAWPRPTSRGSST